MSVQRYKLIFILIFFIHIAAGNEPHPRSPGAGRSGAVNLAPDHNGRSQFSPRLEYNEWLPVGRGDPLKNDPTYDYSPPVLERVRYWPENLANKDKGKDILLLGVPSMKSSTKVDQPWSNGGPMRRNYYHHQINQLPTVLMPPPMNNHLQPDGGDIFLWTQATTRQTQRFDTQGEAFRYKPAPPTPATPQQPEQSYISQYSGVKYTEPTTHVMTNPYQQQPQSTQQYTTTIRLTTPHDMSRRKPILHTILQNEKAHPFTKPSKPPTLIELTSNFYNPQNINALATTIIHPPQTTEYLITESSKIPTKVSTEIRAPFVTPAAFVTPLFTSTTPKATTSTTTSTSTTTTTTTTMAPPPAVTADSLFSHYNRPAILPKGPHYLIIEGHSKVKTYGLNTNDTLMMLPKMIPVASLRDPLVRRVVNRDETGGSVGVRRVPVQSTVAPAMSSEEETSEERSAVGSLLSLLDSSFGDYLVGGDTGGNSIDSKDINKDSKARRNIQNAQDRRI
ncbi:mucin-2 [Toxorhynchites rutilus septentrionalis]|uniref:mucin-2 n=1 Tax=Toxorhynchites rutilus septentrionalis TaxID=329112 RepID=UPI00247AC5EB|nr:mucin-2 [Toxorhynchites rutilus septentrionalis]